MLPRFKRRRESQAFWQPADSDSITAFGTATCSVMVLIAWAKSFMGHYWTFAG